MSNVVELLREGVRSSRRCQQYTACWTNRRAFPVMFYLLFGVAFGGGSNPAGAIRANE